MGDMGDYWRDVGPALKGERQGRARRGEFLARETFHEAQELAARHGLRLACLGGGIGAHYQLTTAQRGGWLINFYPSNGRIYMDRNRPRAPFLRLPEGRTRSLVDLVGAAIRATDQPTEGATP